MNVGMVGWSCGMPLRNEAFAWRADAKSAAIGRARLDLGGFQSLT